MIDVGILGPLRVRADCAGCWGQVYVSTARQVSAVLIEDGPVVKAVTVGDHPARGRLVLVPSERRQVRRGGTGGATPASDLPALSRGPAA